jgi:hypothetical protein
LQSTVKSLRLKSLLGDMVLDSTVIASIIALLGVLLGWGLGHLTQLALVRRQEARDLANIRRGLYADFLTTARKAMNHLAEGSLNRINGAIERGAYAGRFFDDHEKLQSTMSTMELISSSKVLNLCRQFSELQWSFANDEANADPVDRAQMEPNEWQKLGENIMARMNEMGETYNSFIEAARKELRIPTVTNN